MSEIIKAWNRVEASPELTPVKLAVYLLLGGLLSLYVRLLYRYFNTSPSETDSITRVFPLLTIITTGVIAVVKSSLALSLGLVGALSIVRFRSAIKEPEELVYLFLCIAIGLAFGAEQGWLAVSLTGVATFFVVLMHLTSRGRRTQNLLLTITGDTKHFSSAEGNVLAMVDRIVGRYTVQRMDVEQGRGQVRIILPPAAPNRTNAMMTQLREKLPECEFSYINLNATL